MSIHIPKDRLQHIEAVYGVSTDGRSPYAIFDELADKAGISEALNANQKLTVLRRMGGKKKWRGKTISELVYQVLKRDHNGRNKAAKDRASLEARRVQQAIKDIQKERIAATLLQPVTRLASQAEHLNVLAGLPSEVFYRSVEWRATRVDVLRLAGFKCEWCGASSKQARLHADHITPRAVSPQRAFELNNLRCLCEDCHMGRHTADRGIAP